MRPRRSRGSAAGLWIAVIAWVSHWLPSTGHSGGAARNGRACACGRGLAAASDGVVGEELGVLMVVVWTTTAFPHILGTAAHPARCAAVPVICGRGRRLRHHTFAPDGPPADDPTLFDWLATTGCSRVAIHL